MAHFEISVTQSYGGFMASHESLFGNPSREPGTLYISTTTEASRHECAASQVGGTTHGPSPEGSFPAAHQPEPNLGRSAQVFEDLNAPQMRQDNYLARRGMFWIVFAVSWFLCGLIFAFGPGLIAKAAESISFYTNH